MSTAKIRLPGGKIETVKLPKTGGDVLGMYDALRVKKGDGVLDPGDDLEDDTYDVVLKTEGKAMKASERRLAPKAVKNFRASVHMISGDKEGSGYLLGEGKLADDRKKQIEGWYGTAAHLVGVVGKKVKVKIQQNSTTGIVRYRNEADDLAFVSVPKSFVQVDALEIAEGDPMQGEQVWIYGYAQSGPQAKKAGVHTAIIQQLRAGPKVAAGDTYRSTQWKTSHFLMLDRVSDFGLSGGAVVNGDGEVVAMLCESNYEAASWALRCHDITNNISAAGLELE
eukprot:gb/GEZN01008533.1/.p1 GENE.gb/GEZN01008533.1/~~gb/GEZN01008533.1/.p1  ORF type:complete len:281 (+),score=45.18 gb/GEZN01008533.1/:48-890(+)